MPRRPDDDLLAALDAQHGPALHRYVRHLTRADALADDIVQETMLRAWQHPAALQRGDDATRAWLFTVARNLVVDHVRSAAHRREFTTDQLVDTATADSADAVLDGIVVGDALATLSPEHRGVIVDAYWLGHTIPEIAERRGIPAGTVKSRLHYALRALRLVLQERGMTR
jgi:RNA polymerase sigma-70 factor (ECF subfamily)